MVGFPPLRSFKDMSQSKRERRWIPLISGSLRLMSLNDRRGAEVTFYLPLCHWFKQGHCRQLTCIKISDHYRGRAYHKALLGGMTY
jgi:hypothetical protein